MKVPRLDQQSAIGLLLFILAVGMGYLLVYSWSLQVRPEYADLLVSVVNTGNTTIQVSELSVSSLGEYSVNITSGDFANDTSTLAFFRTTTQVIFYLRNIEPGEERILELKNIDIDDKVVSRFSDVWMHVDPIVTSDNLHCELIFRVLGTNLVNFSLATLHSFEYDGAPESEVRIGVLAYLPFVYFASVALLVGLLWCLSSPKNPTFFPIATLAQVTIALFLFIFGGSGPEALYTTFSGNPWLFWPLSPYYHGYNWHINANLITFLPVSIALEYSTQRLPSRKNRIKWLALPWLSSLTWSGLPLFLFSRAGGYGMSLMIEAALWTYCTYLLVKRPPSAFSGLELSLVIISGFSSYTFFGWFLPLILGVYPDGSYNHSLAWNHVAFGVIALAAFLVWGFLRLRGDRIRDHADLAHPTL